MADFLLLAFIFLAAGIVAVPIATRLGFGSVLGYLIAGIAISPVLALLGVDVVSIQHIAEFGVVMMLFLIGLELEPRQLWSMRIQLLGLGGGQILLTVLAVMGVALLFDQPWSISLAIGLVLALSSTAIVLQTLNEKGLMKSPGGESSFSILLTQDIAVIPFLAFIPLLAISELAESAAAPGTDAHGHDDHGFSLSLVDGLNEWQTAIVTLAAIGAVILGGNYLTRPAFRFISMAGLRELFVATALSMVVGIALLMSLVGLSPALGTFIAGVVLANSEYRHELESDLDPFRGLFLGVFFMTVGAGINFGLLWSSFGITILLTLGLIALKMIILYTLGTVFGLRGSDRWLMTLGLAQAGEFGFVLLSFSLANNVLPAAISDQLLLVIALSMLLTPLLFIFYDRVIAARAIAEESREEDTIDEPGEVIIAGYGRIGTVVDRMLLAAGYKTTVIDYDSNQIDSLRKFGARVYYGDATRPDLLMAAGIERAKVLVICIDNPGQVTKLAEYAITTYPNLHVIAAARNRHHVYELWEIGCRDIIRETYDSALRIGRSAFEATGIPREKAKLLVDAFNEMDRKAMLEVADAYDPAIPPSDNEAYVARVREIRGPWQEELGREMREILNS
jgi:CPA2 family monovalent cation:H+ antiporter-2